MTTACVTGGAGFIGSHIVHHLEAAGHDVRIIDPGTDDIHERRLEHTGARRRCEEIHECDLDFSNVDVVYHFAAQPDVHTSVVEPVADAEYNVMETLRVLDAARRSDVDRVVLASSSAIYGTAPRIPTPESTAADPESPYGVAKAAVEAYARQYATHHGVPFVALRFFNVYGAFMRTGMAIPDFVTKARADDLPFTLLGDPSITRDYIHVDDVARLATLLATDDSADGEALNVGTGEAVTIEELARLTIDAVGADTTVEKSGGGGGDAQHTLADISKTQNLLGFTPEISITDGIHRYASWYDEHADWYEPHAREHVKV